MPWEQVRRAECGTQRVNNEVIHGRRESANRSKECNINVGNLGVTLIRVTIEGYVKVEDTLSSCITEPPITVANATSSRFSQVRRKKRRKIHAVTRWTGFTETHSSSSFLRCSDARTPSETADTRGKEKVATRREETNGWKESVRGDRSRELSETKTKKRDSFPRHDESFLQLSILLRCCLF